MLKLGGGGGDNPILKYKIERESLQNGFGDINIKKLPYGGRERSLTPNMGPSTSSQNIEKPVNDKQKIPGRPYCNTTPSTLSG